jgi:Polyketide cyclase / dehydrase and lipid transport
MKEVVMWSSTYTQSVTGVSRERVWDVYSDVESWPSWQDDVQYARLEGPFETGGVIRFKPKGGPKVRIDLTEVSAPSRFVDTTRFLLARMVDVHELVESDDGLEIRNTTSVEGPLAWVWRKLVAEGVADSLPEQTSRLVARAAGV